MAVRGVASASGGGGGGSFADPTGVVGLVAVPGSAETGLRSDSAPPLDQGIAPTWTAAHIFTNAVPITVSNADPRILINCTGGGSNAKLWDFEADATNFRLRTRTDADGAGITAMTVTRSGTAITGISFGQLITVTNGVTTTGPVTGGRFAVSGSTIASNGIYLPSANTLGVSANSTLVATFDATNGFIQSVAAFLARFSAALPDGAAAASATLTNAPTAGNPTKWVPINDNGTTRYIPAW